MHSPAPWNAWLSVSVAVQLWELGVCVEPKWGTVLGNAYILWQILSEINPIKLLLTLFTKSHFLTTNLLFGVLNVLQEQHMTLTWANPQQCLTPYSCILIWRNDPKAKMSLIFSTKLHTCPWSLIKMWELRFSLQWPWR